MSIRPRLKVGDLVKPKTEWIGSPNNIPTGRIRRIEPFGDDGAIHVDGERRAFGGYVFDKIEIVTCGHCGQRVAMTVLEAWP